MILYVNEAKRSAGIHANSIGSIIWEGAGPDRPERVTIYMRDTDAEDVTFWKYYPDYEWHIGYREHEQTATDLKELHNALLTEWARQLNQ